MKITALDGLEILDSRGKPTVRAFVGLEDGSAYSASVPSGASTGTHEAVELRDGDERRHLGQGVQKALQNIREIIAPVIIGLEAQEQDKIDQIMIELDGTENKSKLGANAILAVSMAVARAGARCENLSLWRYLHQHFFPSSTPSFPRLMVNIVNGGKHAHWNFDIQEFMIVPKSCKPSESTRVAAEVFQQLGKNIKKAGLSSLVGDEGGYSPDLGSNEAVIEMIVQAARELGYENVKDYHLALDCAATEFYKDGVYMLQKTGDALTHDKLMQYYQSLRQKYHIESFEDPFAEDDWVAWKEFASQARQFGFQVVGDDHYVTNPKRIRKGIDEKSANAVLIKVNQIGTLYETVMAIKLTQQANWAVVVSHRSGETEDNFIADLAYACGAQFIKTGSMSRSDRLAKYNRLLEIEAGY
jgi:enolase